MRATFKFSLIILCLVTLLHGRGAYSENEASGDPVPSVAAIEGAAATSQDVAPDSALDVTQDSPQDSLTVLELFSSQACLFCPKADELFAAMLTVPDVIGVACHVDYFDVRVGSLARPFCSARQSWYMQTLGAGPNYTPQIVLNGAVDVIGYKLDAIKDTINKAQKNPPLRINVSPAENKGGNNGENTGENARDFTLSWKPQAAPADNEPAILWLLMIDKPHQIQIADGRNKGKQMTYMNIVSDIEDRGDWNRQDLSKTIQVDLTAQHQGFTVIAQGRQTGRILAAAQLSARMLLQVHDELIFEVPEAELEATAALVKNVMENVAQLNVPLEAEAGYADNWSDAH
ncbi:MAG TPA: DNA polymerase [Micavibrio sp.]